MESFDLTKFRNQLLAEESPLKGNDLNLKTAKQNNATNSIGFAQDDATGEGGAVGEALGEDTRLRPDSPQISQYWDIMVENQPEDVVSILTDLTSGKLSYQEFLKDIEADIYDSFRDEFNNEDKLDEGQLEEMASFYKLTDNSPEAKVALQAAKEKFKPGTTIYNTLDALEKNGEIDYKELAKQTGKDIATFNNPKSREVLEKDLAAYIQAGSSPSAIRTGRPADPNKVNSTPKEKTPKLKITNPKPTSTKLKDLAPSGLDADEMDMEKQALKAAKGNKRLGNNIEKLAQVTKEMKALAKEYQAAKGTPEEANIVAQLKTLTAEKKALEKKTTPKQMTAADLMGDEDI